MTEYQRYDAAELKHLWKLNYEELAIAPAEQPEGRLRDARFVMQAKVASETRQYMLATTWATVVMAIATIVMAVGTFVK